MKTVKDQNCQSSKKKKKKYINHSNSCMHYIPSHTIALCVTFFFKFSFTDDFSFLHRSSAAFKSSLDKKTKQKKQQLLNSKITKRKRLWAREFPCCSPNSLSHENCVIKNGMSLCIYCAHFHIKHELCPKIVFIFSSCL